MPVTRPLLVVVTFIPSSYVDLAKTTRFCPGLNARQLPQRCLQNLDYATARIKAVDDVHVVPNLNPDLCSILDFYG